MTDKILFVMPRSAGDVLCSTSLLRSIKELYPESILHFATERQFFDILKDKRSGALYVYNLLDNQQIMGLLRWDQIHHILTIRNSLL